MVGPVPRRPCRSAAEADRPLLRGADGARGSGRDRDRPGGRRGLRPVRARAGRARLRARHGPSRPPARPRRGGARRRPRPAAREELDLDLPAQGRRPAEGGGRPPAGGARPGPAGRPGSPRRAGEAPAAPGRRHRADRTGDLVRGRRRLRGPRRRPDAAKPSRPLRRGRDARLGGADRRVSPPGLLRDRCGGRAGRARLARRSTADRQPARGTAWERSQSVSPAASARMVSIASS